MFLVRREGQNILWVFLPPKDELRDNTHKHCGAGREENSAISNAEWYETDFMVFVPSMYLG